MTVLQQVTGKERVLSTAHTSVETDEAVSYSVEFLDWLSREVDFQSALPTTEE